MKAVERIRLQQELGLCEPVPQLWQVDTMKKLLINNSDRIFGAIAPPLCFILDAHLFRIIIGPRYVVCTIASLVITAVLASRLLDVRAPFNMQLLQISSSLV